MKLMVIGGGGREHAIIKKLKENPAVEKIYCLPGNGGIAADAVCVSEIGAKDIPAQVEFAKAHGIDYAVVAPDDPLALGAVDALSAAGIPCFGPDKKAAVIEASKAFAKDLMQKYNIPTAKYRVFTDAPSACAYIDAEGAPIVVKADGLALGKGVVVAQTVEEAKAAVRAMIEDKTFGQSGARVVIEEFMEGPEVSVETLSVDGKCHVIQITDKITTGAPHFVEMGHTQPSRLDKKTTDEISRIAREANRAVGISNGPSHTEIIVTKDGPKIVELGARLGGDCITTHLVPLSTGMNMVESCIKIAMGENPDLSVIIDRGAAIRYFPQHRGTVESIEGLEEARKIDGVVSINIVHDVGETITDVTDSGSRMGFIIAQGSNADAAVKTCEEAMDKIKITIR